jgi:hypothetical protein
MWFLLGAAIALSLTMMPVLQAGVAAQASPVASPGASPVATTGLAGAASWLISQQAEDGSFAGFSGKPDAGTTVDAMTALVAARNSGIDVGDSVDKALSYLKSGDVALVYTQTGVGQAAKLVLGLIAAKQDPKNFANVSPALILSHGQNSGSGIFGTGIYEHALTILALVASGQDVPASAIDALTSAQAPNGGWGYDGTPADANADSNTTSMVIQALVADGQGQSDLVTKGMAYLKTLTVDGGALYSDQKDASGNNPTVDANSTALVAQAELATGADITPILTALGAFQNSDGSFFYNAATPGPNLLATIQAIPALADTAFPITSTSAASVISFIAADRCMMAA